MRRRITITVLTVALMVLVAPVGAAMTAAPIAYERAAEAAALARADVSALRGQGADHAAEGSRAGGMPAAHGLTGREFGRATSELAKSSPGAVAAHVTDRVGAAASGRDLPMGPDARGRGPAGR